MVLTQSVLLRHFQLYLVPICGTVLEIMKHLRSEAWLTEVSHWTQADRLYWFWLWFWVGILLYFCGYVTGCHALTQARPLLTWNYELI